VLSVTWKEDESPEIVSSQSSYGAYNVTGHTIATCYERPLLTFASVTVADGALSQVQPMIDSYLVSLRWLLAARWPRVRSVQIPTADPR
jgi:hypothetical protein